MGTTLSEGHSKTYIYCVSFDQVLSCEARSVVRTLCDLLLCSVF